jgi:hypothetical protein
MKKLRERYLAEVLPGNQDFVDQITDNSVERILAALPSAVVYVLKTHRGLPRRTKSALWRGTVTAFTSFRDPRDAAVSLLDHGIARATDKIVNVATLTQAINSVSTGHRFMLEWAGCRNVVAFPYYLTAGDRNYAVEALCRHIGLPHMAPEMGRRFGDGGHAKIWMFNKGIADRFADVLSPEQLALVNKELTHEVEAYEGFARAWMRHHNRQMLYLAMKESRDRRLSRPDAVGAVDTTLR